MPSDAYLTRDEFFAYKKVTEKELEVLQLQQRNQELDVRRVEYWINAGIATLCATPGLSYMLFLMQYKKTELEGLDKVFLGMSGGLGMAALIFLGFSYVTKSLMNKNSQKMGDLEKELENARWQPGYRSLVVMRE